MDDSFLEKSDENNLDDDTPPDGTPPADTDPEIRIHETAQNTSAPNQPSQNQRNQPADAPESSKVIDSEELYRKLHAVLRRLHTFWHNRKRLDKFVLAGACGMILSIFFPWVNVARQGTILGISAGGPFLFLLAAGLIATVYVRTTAHWRISRAILIYGQAAMACMALLYLIVQLVNMHELAAKYMPASVGRSIVNLDLGLLLALVSAGVCCFGTIKQLKQKHPR